MSEAAASSIGRRRRLRLSRRFLASVAATIVAAVAGSSLLLPLDDGPPSSAGGRIADDGGGTLRRSLEARDGPPPSEDGHRRRRTRKVVIEQSLPYVSGGPEALVQLALAFRSWLPDGTFAYSPDMNFGTYGRWLGWYPSLALVPILGRTDALSEGDVLIIPEMSRCPVDLVERGVNVYIWQLGAMELQDGGCGYISHNFYLSHAYGLDLPRSHVLRPYMNAEKTYRGTISNDRREDLVLINGHDDMNDGDIEAVKGYCGGANDRGNDGCRVVVLHGFDRDELVDLYDRAKVVVALCMRGSERSPIEAVLRGVVLVSNDCQSGRDRRDFPIPERNVVSEDNPMAHVLERILSSRDFGAKEQADYEEMRNLYLGLGQESLAAETKRFMASEFGAGSVGADTIRLNGA